MAALAEIVFLIILGLPILYLAVLSLLALTASEHKSFAASRSRTFALVIPAHNEEKTIGGTIRSILALDYPKELFDVIVVADNCTDATASTARELGVVIHERHNPLLRGKGYA